MKASRSLLLGILTAALVAATASWFYLRQQVPGPAPGSAAYEQLVTEFYRGLAALDTGLLDNAKTSFARATALAPREPAPWANLGVARLRGAEFDAAAEAVERAVTLAPDRSDLAMLRGALENARGHLDAALAAYRRATELDGRNVRARFALADVLERAGGPTAASDAQQQLREALAIAPGNLAVIVERARLAARMADGATLRESVRLLGEHTEAWPPAAGEQLAALRVASDAADYGGASRAIAFLRNVLARVPEFRDSLGAVRVAAELIADPLDRFVLLAPVQAMAAPPDTGLTYSVETLGTPTAARVLAWPMDPSGAVGLFVTTRDAVVRMDRAGTWAAMADAALLPLDWNHDFRTDLVAAGARGVTLLVQREDGGFDDRTASAGIPAVPGAATGAWTADLDMDGDLDLVIATAADPIVLRNNGDGTSQRLPLFSGISGLRGFTWADFDDDGDPDPALLDGAGTVHVFVNQQAGRFDALAPLPRRASAMVAGDINADGRMDLVTVDPSGTVSRTSWTGARWGEQQVATWTPPSGAIVNRLLLGDLDNNGAADLVAVGGGSSHLWLSAADGTLAPLTTLEGEASGLIDLNDDGRLDVVAVAAGHAVRLVARGTLPYHWQVIRPQAQTAAGDQRINSYGVGGEIEVRSGLLAQKQLITGAPVHVGLGTRTTVDVARIVWPNGVMQAEFDLRADERVVAEQRLKGSCPWVFAYGGEGFQFVTDFLWRSPLGLRINAQDTAGVTQTEDWVRIRGDQLVARDGRYDVRITAELWETHFFDHVSLMVVDHPVGTDVFVDERFSRQPPTLAVHVMSPPTPVRAAWDDARNDVTALVASRDGRHVGGSERGPYQGVTPEHAIEIELGADAPATGPLWIVAQGWIYPTDSSINVAIAQGTHVAPRGLALDVQDTQGAWHVLSPDLGFPAGKNKTVLLDVSARPRGARRFRLRTNLEIYWDAIGWAMETGAPLRTLRLPATKAELRFRGFSRTTEDRAAHAPETPHYDQVANTAPRWRDLIGYHTRFGEVGELLDHVDDRYVIMNAGDELQLSFAAQAPPPAGWTRDFVLIGDGWEKDGDFNTGYSKTVLPLPRHDDPAYTATSFELEQDPAYVRHPDDWQRYHTRFVAPDRYLRGLTGGQR